MFSKLLLLVSFIKLILFNQNKNHPLENICLNTLLGRPTNKPEVCYE